MICATVSARAFDSARLSGKAQARDLVAVGMAFDRHCALLRLDRPADPIEQLRAAGFELVGAGAEA